MTAIWNIVRWEFMRTLRNRGFLIGMFVTPLMMGLFGGVPSLIAKFDSPRTYTYAVVDRLGRADQLAARIAGENIRLLEEAGAEQAAERVLAGEADGFFILDGEFITTGQLTVYVEDGRKSPAPALRTALGGLLHEARFESSGIDPADVFRLLTPPSITTAAVVDDEGETGGLFGLDRRLPTAAAAGILLVVLIMSSGAMLLQSALQEKRDRMSEVILSSVGPDELMAGKIVGHFFVGMVQLIVWLGIFIPVLLLITDLPLARIIAFDMLPLFGLVLLLGYLFYAVIFVSVGATMEDIQSAGNSQGMVFMLPFLSFLIVGPVFNNPEGSLALLGTFFPITTPFILLLRIGITDVPVWEIAVAVAILLFSCIIVTKLAARIFRVGMLMYGKSATPREIWRWLRHS